MTFKVPFLVLVLLSSGTALCSQALPLSCVIDEGPSDESLVGFRRELLAALRTRNFDRLRPLLASDVDASEVGGIDGVVGPGPFRDALKLNDRASPYWVELERLINLGGRFEDGNFCAPYFSCPAPDPDSGDVVIVGKDVPAHVKPSASSPILARLSCAVVKPATDLAGTPPTRDWFGVLLDTGQTAFVPSGTIDRPDRFVLFGKKNGQWRLLAFKAFD